MINATDVSNALVTFSDGTSEIFMFPPTHTFTFVAAELDRLIDGTLEYDRNPGVRVITIKLEYFA
jgi:hypothetical protein